MALFSIMQIAAAYTFAMLLFTLVKMIVTDKTGMKIDFEHTVSVVFDDPFWIVLFEHVENGKYAVAREVLGASEPTNAEITLFFGRLDYSRLRYTTPVEEKKVPKSKIGFKKMQKKIAKAQEQNPCRHTYSKAHTELKRQRDELKAEQKSARKLNREKDREYVFKLRQEKKKQKMKGR